MVMQNHSQLHTSIINVFILYFYILYYNTYIYISYKKCFETKKVILLIIGLNAVQLKLKIKTLFIKLHFSV
jgi:hypothetical protein